MLLFVVGAATPKPRRIYGSRYNGIGLDAFHAVIE
jgi:hypothetical protein